MSLTECAERESKVKIEIGTWELEVRGSPSKKWRRRPAREWHYWLPVLVLAVAVLLVWAIDPKPVLALLMAFYLVGNLLGKSRG